jgi:predicted lipid-binding transport protein (Tim44 family)
MRQGRSIAAAAALLAAALLAPTAYADELDASPTGKGIVGGALLGAEAVTLVEAALDVKPAWAYIVGGLAGGVGGGVGGFFVEQGSSPEAARISMLLLAGGMVLAVPTTVAILSTTAYEPPAEYVQDQAPADEPVAEPPQPVGTEPTGPAAPTTPAAPPPPSSRLNLKRRAPAALYRPVVPPAVLGLESGTLSLSVPAVEVREVYTRKERFEFGVKQETEVRVPVFQFSF